MTCDTSRMRLIVDKDGFTIDTRRGMKVYMNNERIVFTGDSTDDLSLPVDEVAELTDKINLAYKLLVQARYGDIEFNGLPDVRQSRFQRKPMRSND